MRLPFSFFAAWLVNSVTVAALPEPPPMPKRASAPSTNELRGTPLVLTDRGTNFTLFLPHGWTNTLSSNTVLFAHFHTVAWFAIFLQLAKIPAYMVTGVFTVDRWPLAIALGVMAALGVAVAPAILQRTPKKTFALGIDVLLGVSAVWLIVDALRR